MRPSDPWWQGWKGRNPDRVHRRYTDSQQALFDSPYHLTAAWGANGIGKSEALAEYVKRAIIGDLWWQTPGPRTVVLAGNTWMQLGSTVSYLWDRIDPSWFKSTIRMEGGGLHGQRLAVYDVIAGPGKGGELRLGTFRAQNLAGPRAEVVATDEPLPEDVHNELWPRLLGRDGRMVQTYTPTMGTSHKLEYLWQMVDDPKLPWAGEIHTPLDMAAVTPRGGLVDLPWITRSEMERFELGLSRHEAEMRMGRSRRPRTTEAYFSAWGDHLRMDYTPPIGTRIAIGIDHGSKPGAQRASLIYIHGQHSGCRVHIGGHYRSEGRTEIDEDARGILEMLKTAGVDILDVDVWVGDRAHRGDKWGGSKGNIRLQEALALQMGIQVRGRLRHEWTRDLPESLGQMHKPRKYDGSVWDGTEILHRLMVAERITMSKAAECNPLDDDFTSWTAGLLDPAKDGIDSVRYPVVPMYEGRLR